MTYPLNSQAYSIANGASKIGAPLFFPNDPTQFDVSFPIQQTWVNTQTQGIWILEAITASNGNLTAQWRSVAPVVLKEVAPTSSDYLYPLGQLWGDTVTGKFYLLVTISGVTATWDVIGGPGVGDISSLTGNTGGAVIGDASGNVNILGAAGQIAVTGDPGTNTLTLSLTGGGTAIDSFEPDSGTNPVVPDGTGLVRMAGDGDITTVGSLNTLTFNLDGSIATSYVTNMGTAIPAAHILNVLGGVNSGVISLGAGDTITLGMGSPFLGDFRFFSQTPADTEIVLIDNTSDSADSNSQLQMQVAGTSAGDPYSLWNVASTRSYSLGIDNSDSQNFKLTTANAASVNPSSGTLLASITNDGIQTLPLQPAIKVYLAVSLSNQTGGSSGTFVPILFDTVFPGFTQGSISYNSGTGEITIPSGGTGIYIVSCSVNCDNINTTTPDMGFGINVNGALLEYESGISINPTNVRTNRNTATFIINDIIRLVEGEVLFLSINLQSASSPVANSIGFVGTDMTGGSIATSLTLVKIA